MPVRFDAFRIVSTDLMHKMGLFRKLKCDLPLAPRNRAGMANFVVPTVFDHVDETFGVFARGTPWWRAVSGWKLRQNV